MQRKRSFSASAVPQQAAPVDDADSLSGVGVLALVASTVGDQLSAVSNLRSSQRARLVAAAAAAAEAAGVVPAPFSPAGDARIVAGSLPSTTTSGNSSDDSRSSSGGTGRSTPSYVRNGDDAAEEAARKSLVLPRVAATGNKRRVAVES